MNYSANEPILFIFMVKFRTWNPA